MNTKGKEDDDQEGLQDNHKYLGVSRIICLWKILVRLSEGLR